VQAIHPADAGENRPIQRTSINSDRTRLLTRRWMHKAMAWGRGVALCVLVLLLAACDGGTHLTFLNPQGPVADAQRWHFYEVLGIMAVLVAGPIFLLLPFFAWRYRYGNTTSKYSPKWGFTRVWEITAWGGPIVIVAVLAFFVWRDSHRLDPYKPLASDQAQLRVQVIGYDWKWLFIYPDQGIASIGMLAMPAGRPVSMQITSATVMQSLFIPALGSQIYAMGGMVTQLNLQASKPGRFLGENTMYNGSGFHQEHFTTVAMTSADFEAWVSKVRANGIPLDAQTLKVISRRATLGDLIAALPKAGDMDGHVYLTGVSKTLFPAVVEATMDGKATLAQTDLGQVGAASPGAENAAPLMPGQKR
jgi:cytochrome o ubiquinol oxidase subunit II